jgi:rhodanese-related sulfurtransferase
MREDPYERLKKLQIYVHTMTDIITTEDLKQAIEQQGDYLLIDVRRKKELQHGMIPSAHHLPLQEFEEAFSLDNTAFQDRYSFPKPQKDTLIICHCRTGGRSAQAAAYLEHIGYTQVLNYQGSIREWSLIDENVNMY